MHKYDFETYCDVTQTKHDVTTVNYIYSSLFTQHLNVIIYFDNVHCRKL